MEMAFNVVLYGTMFGLAVVLYMLLGGRKLWGPERGVPFCGHPFEQTWSMDPRPEEWDCPKCGTIFAVRDGHWRPVR